MSAPTAVYYRRKLFTATRL